MSTPTINISAAASQFRLELAEQTDQPMTAVLDHALEAYRRNKLFFERMNAGHGELRADAEACCERLAERRR